MIYILVVGLVWVQCQVRPGHEDALYTMCKVSVRPTIYYRPASLNLNLHRAKSFPHAPKPVQCIRFDLLFVTIRIKIKIHTQYIYILQIDIFFYTGWSRSLYYILHIYHVIFREANGPLFKCEDEQYFTHTKNCNSWNQETCPSPCEGYFVWIMIMTMIINTNITSILHLPWTTLAWTKIPVPDLVKGEYWIMVIMIILLMMRWCW